MTEKFDPRFDPAFQRGYDGPTDVAPKPTTQPQAAGRAESARIGSPPPPARTADEPERAAASTAVSTESTADNEAEDSDARRANPYLIALGAISILLVGGGLYLVSRIQDIYASSSANFDFVTAQVLIVASPIIVGIGILTGIGVLFLYAVRWRGR